MLPKKINELKQSGGSLSQRTLRGGFWVFSLRTVQQVFGLARLLILARILAPNDFGLMGMALLTMSTLETFSQTGFQAALIQKKEDIESYLDAAWTVLVLRGLLLFGILYFAAPFAAAFFDAPEARPVIQAIGLSSLFQALTNIGVIYFQKDLEFNKEFIYQFAGTLSDFIVAVTAVLILKNVWALVFGMLAGNAVRCIVSYLIHPYRPHLSRDLKKSRELFGFGKWVLGSSILLFLITQGDDIFVGKLLGATALGFYQLAYRISNMPATEITQVVSSVTFPVYSKIQSDIPKLREAYLKVLQVTAFLSFPIAGMIFVLAPDFTKIFLGEKWMPMVPAMQILVFWGAIRSMAGVNSSVLHAVKRPDIITKLSAIKLPIMAILIYPLSIKYGITGTSLAVFISAIFITPNTFYIVISKILSSKISVILKTVSVPFAGTIFIVSLITFFTPDNLSLSGFILAVTAGIACYFLVTYILDNLLKQNIWYNIKTAMSGVLK